MSFTDEDTAGAEVVTAENDVDVIGLVSRVQAAVLVMPPGIVGVRCPNYKTSHSLSCKTETNIMQKNSSITQNPNKNFKYHAKP